MISVCCITAITSFLVGTFIIPIESLWLTLVLPVYYAAEAVVFLTKRKNVLTYIVFGVVSALPIVVFQTLNR